MIEFKQFKTWQWVFVAFLVVLTLASIVAEFSGSHATGNTHETESHGTPAAMDAHHDTHDAVATHEAEETHDSHAVEQKETTHEIPDPHATEAGHGGGHSTHFWSGIPLFWIWFGAFGCFVITIFAKKLLGPVIYKKEDYYNE